MHEVAVRGRGVSTRSHWERGVTAVACLTQMEAGGWSSQLASQSSGVHTMCGGSLL